MKRYKLSRLADGTVGMVPDESGAWVRFEDLAVAHVMPQLRREENGSEALSVVIVQHSMDQGEGLDMDKIYERYGAKESS